MATMPKVRYSFLTISCDSEDWLLFLVNVCLHASCSLFYHHLWKRVVHPRKNAKRYFFLLRDVFEWWFMVILPGAMMVS
ncbi:hypothetical protein BCR42DRAFT_432925 [Absidia repens]|uniref:Uncharacterized protein n=1 Tax=Absidia repens TaxID=90262 RepID=A0A1X2IW55_9FUNG|nr:hypothetical protein BCR42DRAFT_432925 [Absidia repens]